MQYKIKSTTPGKTIQAIKAVRAVTGFGLKEAKYLVDDVNAGSPQTITIKPEEIVLLSEHGISGEVIHNPLDDLADTLGDFPQDMTVAELVSLLRVTGRLAQS